MDEVGVCPQMDEHIWMRQDVSLNGRTYMDEGGMCP
jgi:hypothetical protein